MIRAVCHRPGLIVCCWIALAVAATVASPDLARVIAERERRLLPEDARSSLAATRLAEAWPDQASSSGVAIVLRRVGGRIDEDRAFARRLAAHLRESDRPPALLRVVGPDSRPEVAARLLSKDGTMQLVLCQLSTAFVSPLNEGVVAWIRARVAEIRPPPGLEVTLTGDAMVGLDQMRNVEVSLHRAAMATVVLLLGVLLLVYRSFWLSAVPLLTVGVGFAVSRALLAWMGRFGWDLSMLVELFLVVILFGTGADLCLLVSWRFRERFDEINPARSMTTALELSMEPLMTSAGTVIVGLSMMGTTRFKLFSSTGPSVAIGLAVTLLAAVTFAPAAMLLLARHTPRSFRRTGRESSTFWARVGGQVLARPATWFAAIVGVMAIPALIGSRSWVVYDMIAEQPPVTPSVVNLAAIESGFGVGVVAPLLVLIDSDRDLRDSRGMAMIDDVGRLLARQPGLVEVRTATQPLGIPAPLDAARINARLAQVSSGLALIAHGAQDLKDSFMRKSAVLRLGSQLGRLQGMFRAARPPTPLAGDAAANAELLDGLTTAAEGAGRIADGGRRAQASIDSILADPFGRDVVDRLLITTGDIRDHPELQQAIEFYLSPDGRIARFELIQSDPVFSARAIDTVDRLRERLDAFLAGMPGLRAEIEFAGTNADWADIRLQSRSDLRRLWILVPLGVFLVLLTALGEVRTCLNLVGTMLLTYLFALGLTHVVFVHVLGTDGIDWKVPYFLLILLVAVGVDYNIFLISRLREESARSGLRIGVHRAIEHTGGLITSAAAITACSFAAFLTSPLGSLRQLGFALLVGITIDAALVRPVLVPCGHWLLNRGRTPDAAQITARSGKQREGVESPDGPPQAAA
jgi:RND superfamily putative drug exporter